MDLETSVKITVTCYVLHFYKHILICFIWFSPSQKRINIATMCDKPDVWRKKRYLKWDTLIIHLLCLWNITICRVTRCLYVSFSIATFCLHGYIHQFHRHHPHVIWRAVNVDPNLWDRWFTWHLSWLLHFIIWQMPWYAFITNAFPGVFLANLRLRYWWLIASILARRMWIVIKQCE